MATTDAASALQVLDALSESGARWALLHGRDKFASNSISDVDVVISSGLDPTILVSALAGRGLSPILVWPYDSCSLTIFIASAGLQRGVQLDVVRDPEGQAKYGVRTDVMLRDRRELSGMALVSELDSWLYSVRKRHLKGQVDRLEGLLGEGRFDEVAVERRVVELFAGDVAPVMLDVIRTGDVAGKGGRRRVGPRAIRLTRRVCKPIGCWAHVDGPDASRGATTLAADLGCLLPHVALAELSRYDVFRRLAVPGPSPVIRVRPGAVVTYGARPVGEALLVTSGPTLEAVREHAGSLMARRGTDQLTWWYPRTLG
jgi:hypothetical protein